MRFLPAACLILIFALSPVFFVVLPARAAAAPGVYYVSPSGSDSTGSGSIGSPYATISHAVAQAAAFYASSCCKNASTVIVEPGTYNEMVVITTSLKLMSVSGQASNTIVNANGLDNGIVVVGPSSAGTVVEGFTTENANNHGIFVQDSSNVRVENNVATNNELNVQAGLGEDKAIQLTGTSNSIVSGNTITGNLYGGIGIADDGAMTHLGTQRQHPAQESRQGRPIQATTTSSVAT